MPSQHSNACETILVWFQKVNLMKIRLDVKKKCNLLGYVFAVVHVFAHSYFEVKFALVFDDDFLLTLRVDVYGSEIDFSLRSERESFKEKRFVQRFAQTRVNIKNKKYEIITCSRELEQRA